MSESPKTYSDGVINPETLDELRLAMYKHLQAGKSMPLDYLELRLCDEVYHGWPTSAFGELTPERVKRHIVCLNARADVEEGKVSEDDF